MKDINYQIKKHEEAIEKLQQKLEEQQNKTEWIEIPTAFNIWLTQNYEQGITYEISNKPLHTNKIWNEQKASLKKGEEVATYDLVQELRNTKRWPSTFTKFWVRVTPNPDKLSEENGSVAWFYADSYGAYLSCGGDPLDSDSALGVFVVRKKIKGKQ